MLAVSASGPIFIMPERVAKTDPFKRDHRHDRWALHLREGPVEAGDRTVYVRIQAQAAPAGLGNGRRQDRQVDRVEWVAMSDQQTAVNAWSTARST